MKIVVMGYSGAGKSTLARAIGQRFGCPVLHLDQVNFRQGWQVRDQAEAVEEVAAFLDQGAWVTDGNYDGLLQERRLKEADRIILCLYPRRICFWQAFRRYLRHLGRTREDMAAGCPEKFDATFMKWILWEGRNRKRRAHYQSIQTRYPAKTAVVRSHRESRRCLDAL